MKYEMHRWLPFEKLRQAIDEGNTECWQLTDRFNATEDFIRKAFYIYRCEGLL